MMKLPRKKYSIVTAAVVVTVSLLSGYVLWSKFRPSQREPKPASTAESTFLLNETYYSCSKELEGKWIEADVGQLGRRGYYFRPNSEQELDKFCRIESIIEYRAVLDILRRDDVEKIVEKYDSSQAWVRALGHRYIQDKSYLGRILPAYSNMTIDCIIVVHSPEGTRFFIENGEKHESHNDHRYLEVPASEFLASLNQAADSDISDFWLGLH